MAKESGLAHALFVDGYDLSGDTGSVDTIALRRNALDVTGIDKSATERITGLVDAELAFSSWFNPSALQEHAALSVLPAADKQVMYFAGSTVGANGFAFVSKQLDYVPSRAADGSLAIKVQCVGSDGNWPLWGDMLTTGKQVFSGAANGTSIDYTAASTTFGAAAFLQVFAFSGTSATFTVSDSANDSAFTPITGLGFTAATGRTTQRLATAVGATIRRYVRIEATGTFSSCTAAVLFRKFEVAQS
jgi:hypothetical protein